MPIRSTLGRILTMALDPASAARASYPHLLITWTDATRNALNMETTRHNTCTKPHTKNALLCMLRVTGEGALASKK